MKLPSLNSEKFQLFFGVALVAVAAVVSWQFLSFAFGAFSAANASVQAAIVAALVAVTSLIVTVWRERSRSFREAHREKKIEVYADFYDLIFEMIADPSSVEGAEEMTKESPMVKRLAKVSRGALFYGSPKVILTLADIKNSNDPTDKMAPLRKAGRVLLAMREDIGLSNRGLNEINVHQLYVNDDLGDLKGKK